MNPKENIIFETLTGSKAYGTNVCDSDDDIVSVCVPRNKQYYLGTGRHHFERWADPYKDHVIYDFRKAVTLMIDGSPNMVELLFTPSENWISYRGAWTDLRAERHLFISKRLRYSFGGYAFAQLKRIKTHRKYLLNPPDHKPVREEFGLPDKQIITNDELHYHMWLIGTLLKDSLAYLNLSQSTKDEMDKFDWHGVIDSKLPKLGDDGKECIKKVTGAPDGFIETCLRERRYRSALHEWESYQNWATKRNPKRKQLEAEHGYDCKHAMHLVRLMRMGLEVMETGEFEVYRPDRKELVEIRNGAWSFQKLEEYAKECDNQLTNLYKTTSLPNTPAVDKIDDIVISILEYETECGNF